MKQEEKAAMLAAANKLQRDMEQRRGAYSWADKDAIEELIYYAQKWCAQPARSQQPEPHIIPPERVDVLVQDAERIASHSLEREEAKKPFKSTVRFEQMYKRIEKAYRTDPDHYESLMDAASCSATDEQWDEIIRRLDALPKAK